MMILMIWSTSVIVSLLPLFGFQDSNFETRVNQEKMCLVRSPFFLGKRFVEPIMERSVEKEI